MLSVRTSDYRNSPYMIANLSMTEQQNSRSLINIGLTKSNEVTIY